MICAVWMRAYCGSVASRPFQPMDGEQGMMVERDVCA